MARRKGRNPRKPIWVQCNQSSRRHQSEELRVIRCRQTDLIESIRNDRFIGNGHPVGGGEIGVLLQAKTNFIRDYALHKFRGKKRLIGTSQNVSQNGHKSFLCRLVFLSFFIACELNFFVCRAGIVKLDYSAASDAVADFQNFFGETVNVHQYLLFENKIMCRGGFDISAKQFDVTSEPLAFGCGLHENSQPGNNQPASKGDGSHPTRYINWSELWHKLNEPSIKWTWTRFVLISLVCFLAGGIAGIFARSIRRRRTQCHGIKGCYRKDSESGFITVELLMLPVVAFLFFCALMKPAEFYFLRCKIFALDCIEYFKKLRFLLRSAYRRLLCILLIIVEYLDLCLDVFRQRFRWFHGDKSDAKNSVPSSDEKHVPKQAISGYKTNDKL